METHKEKLFEIFRAGIAAVAPDQALLQHLSFDGDRFLLADGHRIDLGSGRVLALGAGKGAAPMAVALEKLLKGRIDKGLVVVKNGHSLPLKKIEIVEAAHPVPDEAGARASLAMLELASQLCADDTLICLLTGGASALTSAPAPGLTLDDLQQTTRALLASGATIDELNAIRKHISVFGGGQLARAANGATVLGILVSDVIGDDQGTIGSGPTAPDRSTWVDCLEIVKKYNLELPAAVMLRLADGAAGLIEETPKPEDPIFGNAINIMAANNRQALAGAAVKAETLGFSTVISDKPMKGEARNCARILMAEAIELEKNNKSRDWPLCILAGGETTVTLTGSGLGGRNQEMALAAAIELDGNCRIHALFAGTDGTDGPTEAAGGFADCHTLAKMGGLEKALSWLANNDSNAALAAAGDLLVTGPTRTNVMDMAIILVDGPHEP